MHNRWNTFRKRNRIYKYDYKKRSFKSINIKKQEDKGSDVTKYRVQKIIAFSERGTSRHQKRWGIRIGLSDHATEKAFLWFKQYSARGVSIVKRIYIFILLGTRFVLL